MSGAQAFAKVAKPKPKPAKPAKPAKVVRAIARTDARLVTHQRHVVKVRADWAAQVLANIQRDRTALAASTTTAAVARVRPETYAKVVNRLRFLDRLLVRIDTAPESEKAVTAEEKVQAASDLVLALRATSGRVAIQRADQAVRAALWWTAAADAVVVVEEPAEPPAGEPAQEPAGESVDASEGSPVEG